MGGKVNVSNPAAATVEIPSSGMSSNMVGIAIRNGCGQWVARLPSTPLRERNHRVVGPAVDKDS